VKYLPTLACMRMAFSLSQSSADSTAFIPTLLEVVGSY